MLENNYCRVLIGGYPRQIPESRLTEMFCRLEELKDGLRSKGVSEEIIAELYSVQIIKDEI